MEALQLKIDNLQWEMQRLDKENRELKSQYPEKAKQVDAERELEQAHGDIAKLTGRLEVSENQLAAARQSSMDAEKRTLEARQEAKEAVDQATAEQQRAEELEQANQDLREAHKGLSDELGEAKHTIELVNKARQELVTKSEASEQELAHVRELLSHAESALEELKEEHALEQEAVCKDATLDRYRAVETEREKWEAREQRLIEQLEAVKRNHEVGPEVTTACSTDSLVVKLKEADKQQNNLIVQLSEAKMRITEVDNLRQSQQQEIEELNAEVRLLKTKLRGVELSGTLASKRVPITLSTPHAVVSETRSHSLVSTTISEPDAMAGTLSSSCTTGTATTVTGSVPLMTAPVLGRPSSQPDPEAGRLSPSPIPVVATTLTGSLPAMTASKGGTTPFSVPTAITLPTVSTTLLRSPLPHVSVPGVIPTGSPLAEGRSVASLPTTSVYTPPATYMPSSTPLLSQLPQILPFKGGETGDGETFQDWLEQFESVALLGGWGEHGKLVNLTTRLRGAAYSFYRSCTPEQRSSYPLLVGELKKRFTPVQLTAIQTQLFHDRQQGAKESVDEFAQALRKLFSKAYASVVRDDPGSNTMGQTVLANQFVSGLRPELKAKVVGTEGKLEQLVLKARFEEAKKKELSNSNSKTTPVPKKHPTASTPPVPSTSNLKGTTPSVSTLKVDPKSRSCFNCGMQGHMKRACPYPPQQKGDRESHGRKGSSIACVRAEEEATQSPQEVIEDLRRRLHAAELTAAVSNTAGIIKNVTYSDTSSGSSLGPTITAGIEVNGMPTEALVDTGSPVTIISLDFAMVLMARERSKFGSVEDWKAATLKKFEAPEVNLKGYGGGRLDLMAQLLVSITQGGYQADVKVLVRKDAPNRLLLGTDAQVPLGFFLFKGTTKDRGVNLVTGETFSLSPETADQGRLQQTSGRQDGPETEVQHLPPPSSEGAQEEQTSSVPSVLSTDADAGTEATVVRLLTATRIPAGYQKMVQAKVDGHICEQMSLFTPHSLENNLRMPDGAVDTSVSKCVVLVVQNHGTEPVCLKKGLILGEVVPVTEYSSSDLSDSVDDCMSTDGGAQGHEEATVCELTVTPEENQSPDIRKALLLSQLDLAIDHLSPEDQKQLETVIVSYSDVFALDARELGTTNVVRHTIDTGSHPPVKQPLRRTPFALRAKVDKLVQEMLSQEVIKPSQSPWASPVVLVSKKDGGLRFCVDYRGLNRVTKLDTFPLPRIDDTLDQLAGTKFYSTLDLASGYWQVEMDPSSQEKTAFTTYSGLYEFRKMPFGLVNAPATFQRLMEVVLAGLAREVCLVYLDDVLVMGKTLEEHNLNLKKVLDRLRGAGLRLKPKKCFFAQLEVEYLGHVVSANGVSTDPKKLTAVSEFPTPTNVKEVRSFVGLASYYRKFIPNFSKVAGPLHSLTKKDIAFMWTPQCQSSFEKLKQLLTSAPLLSFPKFDRPFLLETDASGTGLGAVLAQRQEDGSVKPIAYASRSLQQHEKNYGITELEGLGVVWAAKHFRHYLYGHKCQVYTDHEALKALLNTPRPSGKLARWGMALQELDMEIFYRPGRGNSNADALSRSPLPESGPVDVPYGIVSAVVVEKDRSTDDLPQLQRKDPELAATITYLETGILPVDEKFAKRLALTQSQFTVQDDILYHVESDGTLRVIPPTESREQLFKQAHGGKFGGHLRDAKVHSELQRHYWWPTMRRDVGQWSRGCLVCATHSTGRTVKPPLTPIPVAGPFDRIGVDVIQFPRSQNGNQYALVFMDYLTKWPEVFAIADQSAATIAKLLVEEVVSRHGVPAEILSDRGRAFLSGLMKEVELLLGFHKVNTTAYHPQTDGLVERFNRTLTAMLAKTAQRGGRDWDRHLPYVLFAYRASLQESTQESPFFLLYGRDPRLPTEKALSPVKDQVLTDLNEYGVELATKMTQAWELARKSIGKAQKRQKAFYDKKTRDSNFSVGERVFLLKPAEKTGEGRKLARPYHGPYRITSIEPNDAYVRRVDRPQDEPILVALQRLRKCPDELPDEFWPPDKNKKGLQAGGKKAAAASPVTLSKELDTTMGDRTAIPSSSTPEVSNRSSAQEVNQVPNKGKYTGRLRGHPRTADAEPGDM